ncbi:MAG: hypothetical protein A3H68_03195 [Candidatus Taylorbacteria bacterium RIFCSPLOWO2_02_FULL_46_40]|uniref:GlcNAc-PI de-N-acetylase n=1 Tax=Candidatus Taylorbacteria bacterium RIFCSPLOWO2_02_FULL_46_40 TaxID=1802329 RepID=A0A1G2P1C7_9BACT|nr:MAG: hypothetical protein A3H68_03195 [Candidatus Taylorbacteria bacterium RIFCSPLOWO2_02_FULL_46_40]
MSDILVIAPHPDDEVLGCGGVIKKYTKQGDSVFLCVVTKAYTPEWSGNFIKNRKKEVACANEALGIKKTFFLDFPTVKLDTIPQKELNDSINNVVKDVNPDILYIPYEGDLCKDHRLIFESCLVVARPLGNNIKKILAYETLSETEWGIKQFVPTTYINITETLEDKLKAMSCYKSELKNYPHPRSLEGIMVLAKKRGIESGLLAAEAFIIIREIV